MPDGLVIRICAPEKDQITLPALFKPYIDPGLIHIARRSRQLYTGILKYKIGKPRTVETNLWISAGKLIRRAQVLAGKCYKAVGF